MTEQHLRDPVHFFNERGNSIVSDKHKDETIRKLKAKIQELETTIYQLAIKNQFLMSITDQEDIDRATV